MITEKVNNLFTFIDFLHCEIAYFQSKKPLIDELLELGNRRNDLKPDSNYKDRIEYNKIQAEISKKFDVVQPQTTTIILKKALELDIAPMNTPSLNLSAQSDLFELQRNFEESDLPQINETKKKYLEFRTQTDCHYFLQMFFNDLDRDLKEFFDYFKENIDENDFKLLEVKTIKAYDIKDVPELMLNGYKNITIPTVSLINIPNQENDTELSNFSIKYDFRYSISDFLEENKVTQEIQKIAGLINTYGYFSVQYDDFELKIYTPQLTSILTNRNLIAKNIETNTEVTINGWDYFKTYAEAYKEGEHFFETEFKVSPNTLFGENAKQYVQSIHLNYFHVQHTGVNEGWAYVKNTHPYILTHKAIKKFGYYSGIVNKIDELVKKFPKQFAAFDQCEHNSNAQPISLDESRTKKTIVTTITNIAKQGWQYAFVSEQDYNLFTDLLTNFFEYSSYTLPEATIKLRRGCKTKVAKALGDIHKELSNENKLINDTDYFQLVRVLSHFEKETERDLYKALTR